MVILFLVFFFRNYRSKFQSEETVMFCLRVMVGVIVLYDHVHPLGAFVKSSHIDVSTIQSLSFYIAPKLIYCVIMPSCANHCRFNKVLILSSFIHFVRVRIECKIFSSSEREHSAAVKYILTRLS